MSETLASLFYWTGAAEWACAALLGLVALGWWLRGIVRPPRCRHRRQLLEPSFGDLVYRCLDCGETTPLGHVFPSAYCHRRAS